MDEHNKRIKTTNATPTVLQLSAIESKMDQFNVRVDSSELVFPTNIQVPTLSSDKAVFDRLYIITIYKNIFRQVF